MADIVPSPDEQPSFAEAAVKNKKWFKIKSETLDTNSDIVEWNCKNIQYQFQSDKGNTSPIEYVLYQSPFAEVQIRQDVLL